MAERLKILVADDDPSIREILSVQLARLGYGVITADDGREAVAAYAEHRPDLIILDLLMPQLDGLSACREIRALEKKSGHRVPVLFLTARDAAHGRTSAALSGGDDFVTKPVSLDELVERVTVAIGKAAP